MAESDISQEEQIAQIQGFFQLKSETDLSFLRGQPIPAIDGILGDENSATNLAISSWLEEQNLSEAISPQDPDYLDKLYAAIRTGMVNDPAITARLEEMSAMPGFLSEEEQIAFRAGAALHGIGTEVLTENARMATMEAAMGLRGQNNRFSVAGQRNDDPLTPEQQETANEALEFLRQNGLSGELDIFVGEEIDNAGEFADLQSTLRSNEAAIKQRAQAALTDSASLDATQFFMWQSVLGMMDPDQYGTSLSAGALGPITADAAWSSPTLNALSIFTGTSLPGAQPYVPVIAAAPAATVAATPDVTEGSAEYTEYYMNNVVLTNGNFSIHARKVWEDMQENPELAPGDAIENYIIEYAGLWGEANENRVLPEADRNELRSQLIDEVSRLRNIEAAVEQVRPTPELMADNFVENRVLPELSEEAREVWQTAQEEGISFEEAADNFIEEARNAPAESGPGPRYSPAQILDLEANLLNDVQAVSEIRESIIQYENLEITTESALDVLRGGWARIPNLPGDINEWSTRFEDQVAHYQSAEGGTLDIQTAVARAAVDIRAEMDRAGGIAERMIVDENHSWYQNDVMQMGDWMRDRIFFEENGGVDQETAERYGLGDRNTTTISRLDFYTNMYGGAYRIYRRENLEEAMTEAYETVTAEAMAEAHAEMGPEEAQAELASVETQQLELAAEVIQKFNTLRQNETFGEQAYTGITTRLTALGIDLSSPEALVEALQDPAIRAAASEEISNLNANIREQVAQSAIGGSPLATTVENGIKDILNQAELEDLFASYNTLEIARISLETRLSQLAATPDTAAVTPEFTDAAADTYPEGAGVDLETALEQSDAQAEENDAILAASTEFTDAAAPVVAEEGPAADIDEEASAEVTEATIDLPVGMEGLIEELDYLFDDYIYGLDFSSPEQISLMDDATELRQTMMDQFNSGDFEGALRTIDTITSRITTQIDTEKAAFVEQNWDTIAPFFEEAGIEVEEGDYERVFEVLADPDLNYRINQATTRWDGAAARNVLFEKNDVADFNKDAQNFSNLKASIEELAAGHEIELPTDELTESAPAEPETGPDVRLSEIDQQQFILMREVLPHDRDRPEEDKDRLAAGRVENMRDPQKFAAFYDRLDPSTPEGAAAREILDDFNTLEQERLQLLEGRSPNTEIEVSGRITVPSV